MYLGTCTYVVIIRYRWQSNQSIRGRLEHSPSLLGGSMPKALETLFPSPPPFFVLVFTVHILLCRASLSRHWPADTHRTTERKHTESPMHSASAAGVVLPEEGSTDDDSSQHGYKPNFVVSPPTANHPLHRVLWLKKVDRRLILPDLGDFVLVAALQRECVLSGRLCHSVNAFPPFRKQSMPLRPFSSRDSLCHPLPPASARFLAPFVIDKAHCRRLLSVAPSRDPDAPDLPRECLRPRSSPTRARGWHDIV